MKPIKNGTRPRKKPTARELSIAYIFRKRNRLVDAHVRWRLQMEEFRKHFFGSKAGKVGV